MKVQFLGAAGEVTGSCYLIESAQARILIDFGLHQGGHDEDLHNRRPLPVDFRTLSAVLLTHAHIDHSGRLPLLPSFGFLGPIFATEPTVDLCGILLRDTARLQEADAARTARRAARFGKSSPLPALFGSPAVEQVLHQFRPVSLGGWIKVAPGIRARWVDAGHLLGAASLDVRVADGASEKRIIFSGDVGPNSVPLMNDPVNPAAGDPVPIDLLIHESTYGDHDHRSLPDTIAEGEAIVREAVWAKEKILVPAFAVGRAQAVMYLLARLIDTGRVPAFPICLDSPMAISAMRLYRRYTDQLDHDAHRPLLGGELPLASPHFRMAESIDESRALNDMPGPLAIVAGSGMCNGGRILHHLRHNVWRKGVHVVIAGYQAEGTLGRALVRGAPEVKIFGETYPVRATVHTLGGLSAHAGRTELIAWARAVHQAAPVRRLALTHGEDGPRRALAQGLSGVLPTPAILPDYLAAIEL